MGAPACGACETTERGTTAQMSRAQAAPLPRVLRGCAHGAIRPQQTRGVRVAPDAAQEHAASSAAERSRTLAEAEAAPRAQARRESSQSGAQHSCYLLVHHGTRQLRGQRAAWRRSVAQKKAATLAHVSRVLRKRAAARAAWRDTRGVEREPYDSRRERRAPEAFQHGAASRNASLNCMLGVARCSAAEAAEHSAHMVQLCEG
jgi:hypothetical protein